MRLGEADLREVKQVIDRLKRRGQYEAILAESHDEEWAASIGLAIELSDADVESLRQVINEAPEINREATLEELKRVLGQDALRRD